MKAKNMKINRILVYVMTCISLLLVNSSIAESYRLASGDVIRIHVYDEADLTFENLLVGNRGTLAYPFIGDLSVRGKTIEEVEKTLVRGLRPDYLVDPKITVSIVEYRPFFINGEVTSPGGIEFSPGLTLRKAVSLAGGFTERASRSNITVIQENQSDGKARKVGLDYQIQPGDVLTVAQSFF